MREYFGQYGQKFIVENLTEESTREKVAEYFEILIGKEFSIEETKSIVQDLKKLGLTNAKQRFNYSFSFFPFRSFWFATLTKRGLWNLATLFRRPSRATSRGGPARSTNQIFLSGKRIFLSEKTTPFPPKQSKKNRQILSIFCDISRAT